MVDWAENLKASASSAAGTVLPHVAALSLKIPDSLAPQDVAAILDTSFNIAVRPGLHCAPYIHRALETFPQGTIRLSPGAFNTPDDIQSFIDALSQIAAVAHV